MKWTREQLARLEPGVQPEERGRLLCRYCGRWFRSLGHHLVGPRHRVVLDDYRETFELPTTRALMAIDLREATARRQRVRFTDPAVRAVFAVDDPHNAERDRRRRRGLKRKAETEARAGVQRSKQAVGAFLGEVSRRRSAERRAELDDRARKLGYTDLAHFLHATTHLTHAEVGQQLGLEPATARRWRREIGVRSDAKQAAVRARATARPGPLATATGEQPADVDGTLRCLECPTSWADLGKHVEQAHRLSQDAYRLRHGLAVDVSLRSAELDRRVRDAAAAVGRASAQQRRDRFRAGYDAKARAAGYADVIAVLAANTNAETERLLGLRKEQGARIRRRYLPAGPAGTRAGQERGGESEGLQGRG